MRGSIGLQQEQQQSDLPSPVQPGHDQTHLDAAHERRVRIEQHDILRTEFFQHAVVLVAKIRPDDDQFLVGDKAKVLAEINLVERFVKRFVELDLCRRFRLADPAIVKEEISSISFAVRVYTERRTHMLAMVLASSSSASGFAPVAAAKRLLAPLDEDDPEERTLPEMDPAAPPPRTRRRLFGGA